tara:strand:- start:616 stop:810 length:195 start_codon:yes stop_codon:yes gene_type:complete
MEVEMKKYKLVVDFNEDSETRTEEVDSIYKESLDRVWLDTGDIVVQLPKEVIPYLEEADILGIA